VFLLFPRARGKSRATTIFRPFGFDFVAENAPRIGEKIAQSVGESHADSLPQQTQAGVLAVDEAEVAAAQFLDACQSTLFKPMLFNFAGQFPLDCGGMVTAGAVLPC
jgi:hypothetical protein